MDSITDEYLMNEVLQPSLPGATNIRILDKKKGSEAINISNDIIGVTIQYQQHQLVQTQHLIIKVPIPVAPNSKFYNCIKLKFHDRERLIYSELIPQLHQMPALSHLLPTHHFSTSNNIIVLDDLTVGGYSAPESPFFDLEQSKPILAAVAKFHAATYSLHQQNATLLADPMFRRCPVIDVRTDFLSPWQAVICELFARKQASDRVAEFQVAMEYLRNCEDALYSLIDQYDFQFVVLNHGDLRADNIMIKQDPDGQITDVALIDYQISWWSSPAYDFLFYLMFSVQIEVVRNQYDALVDIYWQALETALEQLKCTVQYTKKDFLFDVQRLHFLLAILLPQSCTFCSPLGHQQIKDTLQLEDEQIIRLYCECLEDEPFTKRLWGWLELCREIEIFEILHDEELKRKPPKTKWYKKALKYGTVLALPFTGYIPLTKIRFEEPGSKTPRLKD